MRSTSLLPSSRRMAPNQRSAFTLIELLLVMIILGILAAIIVPSYVGRSEKAKKDAAVADISNLDAVISQFETDVGRFPASLQELLEEPTNVKAGSWQGPYIKTHQLPMDKWGKPYVYECPGQHNPKSFDLYVDGKEGEPDNLNNWSK